MTKQEFIEALTTALKAARIPANELRESIGFYAEAIDDRMEEGIPEEQAIGQLDPIDTIVERIRSAVPPIPRRIAGIRTGNRVLDALLLTIAFPVWSIATLAFAIFAICIYATLWLLALALWAVIASLFIAGIAGVAALIWGSMNGTVQAGVLSLGIGAVAVGVGLLVLPFAVWTTTLLAGAAKRFALWVLHFFVRNLRADVPTPPAAPCYPRLLLRAGIGLAAAGVCCSLAVLASCGFDPSTLPQIPPLDLFGYELQLYRLDGQGGIGILSTSCVNRAGWLLCR